MKEAADKAAEIIFQWGKKNRRNGREKVGRNGGVIEDKSSQHGTEGAGLRFWERRRK